MDASRRIDSDLSSMVRLLDRNTKLLQLVNSERIEQNRWWRYWLKLAHVDDYSTCTSRTLNMIRIILSLVVLAVFVVAVPGGVQHLDTNGVPPYFGKAYKLAKLTLVPIDYIEMTKQVVAGVKYTVKFTAGPVECFGDESYFKSEACTNSKKVCELSYIVQSWENDPVALASSAKHDKMICTDMSEPSHEEEFIDPDLVETFYNETTDAELKALFDQFIIDFGRDYRPDSNDGIYWKRFSVFKKNMRIVRQFNKNTKDSAKYGITKFMDYTRYEYKRFLAPGLTRPEFELNHIDVATSGDTPKAYDWREHGAVTEVKNQGRCGSCWAFSTTGNVEGQWFVKKGKLVSLSEQELVDCDHVDQGCNGGLPSNAYKSIEKLGGLETEKEYPYEGSDEKCQFKKSDAVAFVNDSVTLPSDEDKMATWLYKNGPISIGINALAMQFYMGGVSHPWKFLCNPSSLDHGVLIVGYGVTNGRVQSSGRIISKTAIHNSPAPTHGSWPHGLEGLCSQPVLVDVSSPRDL